ncbi:MAG: DUF1456 family protein [Reichenbachiella sp.]
MLTNNDVLKKLRVAHKLRDEHIIDILKLVNFEITKGALGDMFRDPGHPNYVDAGDQIVRNFLDGLIIHLRGERPKKPGSKSEINDINPVQKDDSKPKAITPRRYQKKK